MLNDKVIRTAFLISFVGHCLFLGVPGINVNSSKLNKPEDIMVRIEIERPPLLPKIDIMGDEKKIKEVIDEIKQIEREPKQKLKPEEIVMEELSKELIEEKLEVIDPSKEAMLRYQDMVKQRIEEVRRYPSWAKRQGIEGIVYLSFSVLSNGLSQDVKIMRSSDSKILNEEAVATIKRANPFPPFPRKISSSSVRMEVSIVFTLQKFSK